MATINKMYEGKNSQKRDVSVAVFDINSDVIDGSVGDTYEVVILPEGAIVTNVFTNITKLDTTAATVACTVKVGSTSVSTAKNIGSGGSLGVTKSSTAIPLAANGDTLSVTVATANPTEAEAKIIVEYIEVDKTNGELTKVRA